MGGVAPMAADANCVHRAEGRDNIIEADSVKCLSRKHELTRESTAMPNIGPEACSRDPTHLIADIAVSFIRPRASSLTMKMGG